MPHFIYSAALREARSVGRKQACRGEEGRGGSVPGSAPAANRKVNEIGTEIEKGAWGGTITGWRGHCAVLVWPASWFKCKIVGRFRILSRLLRTMANEKWLCWHADL